MSFLSLALLICYRLPLVQLFLIIKKPRQLIVPYWLGSTVHPAPTTLYDPILIFCATLLLISNTLHRPYRRCLDPTPDLEQVVVSDPERCVDLRLTITAVSSMMQSEPIEMGPCSASTVCFGMDDAAAADRDLAAKICILGDDDASADGEVVPPEDGGERASSLI